MEIQVFFEFLVLTVGFYMAWNIGANDVSNAMGTSVGSGALTLRKAVFLAAVLEFCGAFFAGGGVSGTMQKGLIDTALFIGEPNLLVMGMCSALLATGIWLQIASYCGWPVSTTHAIVGAVSGFGLIIGGAEAVRWEELITVVCSWVVSPLMSAFVSYIIFTVLQKKILYALNPVESTKRLYPFFVFTVFFVFSLILFFKGLPNFRFELSLPVLLFLSIAVGVFAGCVSYFLVKRVKTPVAYTPDVLFRVEPVENPRKEDFFCQKESEYKTVEKMFVYLQILSACFVAFAHGANDVANAIGPVAAVLDLVKTGSISETSAVPSWLLAFGGFGIVTGLATWGWRVIETIGKKITELTPTRGFCAEFGAASTILIASKMGLPISTTHCLVGAVLGIGFAGGMTALNLGMVRDIILSWVITIPASAVMSIAVFYLIRFTVPKLFSI